MTILSQIPSPPDLIWQTITSHTATKICGEVYRSASYSRAPDGQYAAFYVVVDVPKDDIDFMELIARATATQPLGVFESEPEAVLACEHFCREGKIP